MRFHIKWFQVVYLFNFLFFDICEELLSSEKDFENFFPYQCLVTLLVCLNNVFCVYIYFI